MRKQPESGTKSKNLKDKLQVDLLSFEQLKASTLFTGFQQKQKSLLPFFHSLQFQEDPQALAEEISAKYSQEKRNALVSLLKEQNTYWKASPSTFHSIDKLLDPATVVVVTGHQLSLFGGPLFTVYKLLSIIALCNKLKQKFNIEAVPVFWLADEDHDLPEVLDYGLLQTDEAPFDPIFGTLDLENNGHPVGKVVIPEGITTLIFQFKSLIKGPFATELLDLLQGTYHSGATFKDAFARLMLTWFGRYGVVVISADHPEFKSWSVPVFKTSVESSGHIYESLKTQTASLRKAGFHQQVQFEESHLFRYSKSGKRVKLGVSNGQWAHGEQEFTSEQLIQDIEGTPEEFSPGVLLRLVLQSHLLPVLTVVGGPAEIAYAAQSKPLFEHMGIPMPLFQHRYSATFLETNVKRNYDRLQLSLPLYQQRMEDLESMWLHKHLDPEQVAYFDTWREELSNLHKRFEPMIEETDATLKASSQKAVLAMRSELEHLEGKVRKALKRKYETDLSRIRMVKQSVYPGNQLQERSISAISLYAQHGSELWAAILELFEERTADQHLILSLSAR